MNFYPLSSPIIMTDAIFTQYGGHVGNSGPLQRQAAYLMAEEAASDDLSTLLLPVIVTGTYFFNPSQLQKGLMLDYGQVHRVISTSFIDFDETVYWTQAGTGNDYVALRDAEYGVLDINYILNNCKCANSARPYPYQIKIVYEAGLPTGTANHSKYLMALTIYSDLMLQEIIGYGNEAPGDIGVQQYQNQEYREQRIGLIRTNFGTSARANLAHRLLLGKELHRYSGL